MKYEIKINSLAAETRNGEITIRRFDGYRCRTDLRQMQAAYLEQAEYCIEAYHSLLNMNVQKKLYRAARLMAQVTYAVRQAKAVESFMEIHSGIGK